jgi:hypothetical protein
LPDNLALQVPAIDTAVAGIASSSNDIQVLGLLKTNERKKSDVSVRLLGDIPREGSKRLSRNTHFRFYLPNHLRDELGLLSYKIIKNGCTVSLQYP